jgi:outer membrane protein assembly factor BamD (BamD/ComL family)
MARRRFRRKDLKRPDEFVSRGRHALAWAQEHVRLVAQVGGGVAVVVLLVVGLLSIRGARARQANEDLAQALAGLRAGRNSEAATQLTDVGTRWQSTTPGRIAMLYAAAANLKVDNLDAAAAGLQDLVSAAADWPPYLRQHALVTLGYILEKKGDVAGAATRYNDAASLEGPYTEMAILGEASCRERLGQKDEARKLYERFTREFPQAPDSELVNDKVAALKG